MEIEEQRSRFVGSLLGVAFGDTLGAAVEMLSRTEIRDQFGQVRDFLPHAKGFGCYTDDTEMTLALVLSLIQQGRIDAAYCARCYAEAFTPERGYGRSASRIMEELAAGTDYRQTGTMFFPAGSFGNGAAMRIAPIGLLYGRGKETQLREAVSSAVSCTHIHDEAVETAFLQALAVGLMLDLPAGVRLDMCAITEQLIISCRNEEIKQRLETVEELLITGADADRVVDCFSCGVRSGDSWPPALWAALRFSDDPEEAIIQAVNLGGDADTIGAMTGALVGALYGDSWFPQRWFDSLENGVNGRDEIIKCGQLMAELAVSLK